jgi:hypothetical protein
MALKSRASLPSAQLAIERKLFYSDWPECLPRYAWLVEEGLKDVSKMFNVGTVTTYCKVCGTAVKKTEWEEHRDEHVEQLGSKIAKPQRRTVAKMAAAAKPLVPKYDKEKHVELMQLIQDSLSDKSEQMTFVMPDDELSEQIADVLLYDVKDAEAGSPAVCVDCVEER